MRVRAQYTGNDWNRRLQQRRFTDTSGQEFAAFNSNVKNSIGTYQVQVQQPRDHHRFLTLWTLLTRPCHWVTGCVGKYRRV